MVGRVGGAGLRVVCLDVSDLVDVLAIKSELVCARGEWNARRMFQHLLADHGVEMLKECYFMKQPQAKCRDGVSETDVNNKHSSDNHFRR